MKPVESHAKQTPPTPDSSFDYFPWIIKSDPVTVETVEFRMASGKKVERNQKLHSQLIAMIARHYDGEQQRTLLESREIHKPEWFMTAESDARTFMASLGFNELGHIHLLEGHLDEVIPGYDMDAYHDSITRSIVVSKAKMIHIIHTDGIDTATSVLVHELAHGTAPKPKRIVLQQHADNDSHWAQRNGWLVSGEHGDQGNFLEEGFCEYVAGLYRRRSTNKRSLDNALLPSDYTPTMTLPPHLQTSAVLAGPDAHAIELIAWGVGNKGIMSANEFIGRLFESRNPEMSAYALREAIQAINALSPKLYSYLKNLERTPENWVSARDSLYAIVTH